MWGAQVEACPCESPLIAGKVGIQVAIESTCAGIDGGGGCSRGVVHALFRTDDRACEQGIL